MSNELTIKFNKNLYKNKAIKQAITQFSDWGKFSVISKGDYYVVTIKGEHVKSEACFKDEFSNFVLYYTKSN
ncbi:HxsD-like protein [bacterium]|nr:HxsD-like protein [bacterium]